MSIDRESKALVWKGNSKGRNVSNIRSVSMIRRTEKTDTTKSNAKQASGDDQLPHNSVNEDSDRTATARTRTRTNLHRYARILATVKMR